MAALDFPASPTNGQVYGNWVYSTSKGAWQALPIPTGIAAQSPTAPVSPYSGDLWYNTNDGGLYTWYADGDSSQWVEVKSDATLSSTLGTRLEVVESYPAGIAQIIPSNISVDSGTASVDASGLITFSGATSIRMNNIFTSKYKNYKLVFNAGTVSAAATVLGRVRNAGVAKTTSYYSGWTRVLEGSSTVTGSLAGSSYFFVTDVHPSVPISNSEITIYEPLSTTKQVCFYDSHVGFAGSSTYAGYTGGTIGSASETFDGFQLDLSTGTFGGTVKVYGLR